MNTTIDRRTTPSFDVEDYEKIAMILKHFATVMRSIATAPGDEATEQMLLADVEDLQRRCELAAANGVVYPFGFLEGRHDCGMGYTDGHPLLGFRYTPMDGTPRIGCHVVFRDADMIRHFVHSLSERMDEWLSTIPQESQH